jgi:hypothetical protein
MTQRIDEVADLKFPDEQLATVAADHPVAPDAGLIRHDGKTSLYPEVFVLGLARMNMDLNAIDLQIVQNRIPQINGNFIIVPAKREVSQHFKICQMRTVADQIEVICPDARLHGTVMATWPPSGWWNRDRTRCIPLQMNSVESSSLGTTE